MPNALALKKEFPEVVEFFVKNNPTTEKK